MARVTINNVNNALKAAGIDGEIVKGDGYFYFTGPSFEDCRCETGVYTARLGDMSV